MPDTTTAQIAFTRLYDSCYGQVLAYCLRRTDHTNAHDAAAEVFTIAWKKIDAVPEGDKALIWLYGVAYRVLGHQWRSRRRLRRLKERIAGLGVSPEPDAAAQVVRRLEDRRLVSAAERLGSRDQEILRLAGWEELPHAEIAGLLGISKAAVDQRFHRAKKRLAREYDRSPATRPPTSAKEGGSP